MSGFPLKAKSPIVCKLLFRISPVNPLHSNTPSPICKTSIPLIWLGITTSLGASLEEEYPVIVLVASSNSKYFSSVAIRGATSLSLFVGLLAVNISSSVCAIPLFKLSDSLESKFSSKLLIS